MLLQQSKKLKNFISINQRYGKQKIRTILLLIFYFQITKREMGCCPPVQNKISPGIIQRRESKSEKYNGRTLNHSSRMEKVRKSDIQKTEDDQQMLTKTISQHFLLYRLPKHQRIRMIDYLEIYECEENVEIFKKGDPASLFFIIRTGKVEIMSKSDHKNQKIVLQRGNFFGDLALIYTANRSAGVKSLAHCTFFCISHVHFRKVVQDIVKRNYEQSKVFIEKIPLFRFLTKRQKNAVAYSTLLLKFQEGETLFVKGDMANCLYIIKTGRIKLSFEGKNSLQMAAGESFGQNAFEQKQQRSGTAVAVQRSLLLSISRESLQRCLGSQLKEITFYNILKWSLNRDEIFSRSGKLQIEKLICCCEIRKYKADEIICESGSISLFLVIVLEQKVNKQGVGTIFNTQYLFGQNQNERKLTRTLVKEGTGHVAVIQFQDIIRIFGNNMSQLESNLTSKMAIMDLSIRRNDYLEQVVLEDFVVKGKLGQGQFGKVYYVEDKVGKKYAIKCIQKNKIVQNKMEKFVCKERDILFQINSPFLIKLYKTFKDEHFIYFLTNYIDGADFFDLLRQIGLCNRKKGQFFIGCLILALEHLHQKNIIYRDLKPQNAVIDEAGFLHLIDLGISKVLTEDNGFRTFTIVGTPHYMAPEIVQVQGYSFSADIWSLGVVLYQMMCGTLPFGNNLDDPYEIFKEIDTKKLDFPDFYIDSPGKQLMEKLLSKNPSDRYVEQFTKIKNMAFFQDFNWTALAKKTIQAPFKVKAKSVTKEVAEPLQKYLLKEKANIKQCLRSVSDMNWDRDF